MSLIEFKDLPDTSTPITADNLNNNFNELESSINTLNNTVNEINTTIDSIQTNLENCKTFTFNGEWRTAFKSSGMELCCEIPIYNPNNSQPVINIFSADIFYNSSWQSLTSVTVISYNTNQIILSLNNSLPLTNYNCYLVRITGTVTVN